MARNSFNIDHAALRAELSALDDDALKTAYDEAWEAEFGADAMSNDMIQDCALLEEGAIRDRAIIKIAEEIQRERAALAQGADTAENSGTALEL